MSTRYDDNDQSSEVSFLDVEGKLLKRVTLVRDEAGRIVKEDITMDAGSPFHGVHSGEHQKAIEAAISQIFAGTFSSTTYAYDDRGRLIERDIRMGTLGGDRTRYRYEDRADPLEETNEHTTREVSLNEDGTIRYMPGLPTSGTLDLSTSMPPMETGLAKRFRPGLKRNPSFDTWSPIGVTSSITTPRLELFTEMYRRNISQACGSGEHEANETADDDDCDDQTFGAVGVLMVDGVVASITDLDLFDFFVGDGFVGVVVDIVVGESGFVCGDEGPVGFRALFSNDTDFCARWDGFNFCANFLCLGGQLRLLRGGAVAGDGEGKRDDGEG